ncbi:hypothetical protein [Nocardia pseudovaccinii]|uniref:hypothetical protein n=1 Tax=Nocardia pseudovaccinii TaxID=189540 RepID=UPI000A3FE8CF|nr:hypothetical protein [Nocardia pseudovaccinii]
MSANVYPLLAWAAATAVLEIAGRLAHRPFLRAAARAQALSAVLLFAVAGLSLVVTS